MTLVALGAAWLGAFYFALGLHAPGWLWAACLLLATPAAVAVWGSRASKVLPVAVGLAVVAAWRAGSVEDPVPEWTGLMGNEVVFTGRVVSEPDPARTKVTGYEVEVSSVTSPVEFDGGGRTLIFVPQYTERLALHTTVSVRGELDLPPTFDDFDYRTFLQRRDVYGTIFRPEVTALGPSGSWDMQSRVSDLRLHLEDGLRRSLPEPQGTLAAGIAFGRDDAISSDTSDDFARSGLIHLIAVSGSNVSLIAAISLTFLAPFIGKGKATLLALALVAGYVVVAGLSFSVIRAGLMAAVLLAGWFWGRPQSGLPALAAAAIVLTAISPGAARDPGFQLSFAATAGLIAIGPWCGWAVAIAVHHLRLGRVVPAVVCRVLGLTFAATLATAPLVWYHFGRVTLATLLTNLVAEPVFVLAFGLSWVVALLSLVAPPIAWVAGWLAYYPLAFLAWLAESTATWPALPDSPGHFLIASVLVLGVMAIGLAAYLRPPRRLERDQRAGSLRRRYVLAALAGTWATAAASLGVAPLSPAGELRVDFLDIGQGDATLITTPGGTQILVDGGPSGYELIRELSAVMPHWDRTINVVILTHGDEDHMAGLAMLEDRYSVGRWFDNGQSRTTPAFAAYERDAPGRETLTTGRTWSVDGVEIEVIWPPPDREFAETNEASVVLRVTYEDVSFLLTGDIERDAFLELASETDITVTVLKVPHHGSRFSDPATQADIGAQLAVTSVGCGNTFGHPTEQVLNALAEATVLRTDLHGRVRVTSDGTSLHVHTERDPALAELVPGGSECRR